MVDDQGPSIRGKLNMGVEQLVLHAELEHVEVGGQEAIVTDELIGRRDDDARSVEVGPLREDRGRHRIAELLQPLQDVELVAQAGRDRIELDDDARVRTRLRNDRESGEITAIAVEPRRAFAA